MARQTLLASAIDLINAIDKGTIQCQESAFVDSLRAAIEREGMALFETDGLLRLSNALWLKGLTP